MSPNHNRIFHTPRRVISLLSALILLFSLVTVTDSTWAWWSDNSTASMNGISTANFKVDVTITDISAGTAEAKAVEANSDGTFDLIVGGLYEVSIAPSENSTASSGFCLVDSEQGFAGYTDDLMAASADLDATGQETGVTFTLSLRTADYGEGVNTDTFTFTPSWGSYGASGVALFGPQPVCIENGMILNEYGELLTPEDILPAETTAPTEETTVSTEESTVATETTDPTETTAVTETTSETTESTSEPTETTSEPTETTVETTETTAETTEATSEPTETTSETTEATSEPTETTAETTEPTETTSETTEATDATDATDASEPSDTIITVGSTTKPGIDTVITEPTEETTVATEATTAPTEETEAPTEATTVPTEETAAPTEATTVPTEETAAPTEATTVPTEETEAPTEETEAPTEETTAPTEETEEPTEEPEPELPEEPEETEDPTAKYMTTYSLTKEELEVILAESTVADQGHVLPMYFQDDYPDQRYGAGTVKTSGCGITALAMVASYMTDYEYTPDALARYFGGRAENNIARLELGAQELELPMTKAENFHYTLAALREGKIVIALMDGYTSDTPFTETQHFIVLRGITEDGKIIVNDPNRANYQKWELKNGFLNGFTEKQILTGYSGGWIFDPDAMTSDPYIYYKEQIERVPRYPGLELTFEEQELICRVVWVESRGECAEGQQAVAEVILNRLTSGQFGDSVHDVIYNPGQFRSVPKIDEATPWQAQYDALEAAMYGEGILPKDVYYFATTALTENVWGPIGGHIFCYAE